MCDTLAHHLSQRDSAAMMCGVIVPPNGGTTNAACFRLVASMNMA
jgi:hypothetical protein